MGNFSNLMEHSKNQSRRHEILVNNKSKAEIQWRIFQGVSVFYMQPCSYWVIRYTGILHSQFSCSIPASSASPAARGSNSCRLAARFTCLVAAGASNSEDHALTTPGKDFWCELRSPSWIIHGHTLQLQTPRLRLYNWSCLTWGLFTPSQKVFGALGIYQGLQPIYNYEY